MCAVLRQDSPQPSSLTNHGNKLGFSGRAAREVLATKRGSVGGGWDSSGEYCLSRSVSMGAHLRTVHGIFRTQSKQGKETTPELLARESLSQPVDFNAAISIFNAAISTWPSCP